MKLAIYKPNSKITGCAASFQISSKPDADALFFLQLIKQHSWDNNTKKGSFAESRKDPSKLINIKLNEFELGEILHTLNTGIPYNMYHTFGDTVVTIKFAPYGRARKIGAGEDQKSYDYNAYGFSITRNGADRFLLPLEPGEYTRLAAFIHSYFSLLDQTRRNVKENERPAQVVDAPAPEPTTPVAAVDEMEF